MSMPRPPPTLAGRALRLLAMREYSRQELERRLAPHATEPGQLQAVLDALQAKGFIDAQRVVASVLHRRAAGLGVARVRQELQRKGITREEARDALAGLQATELERARQVWHRKFGASTAAGDHAAPIGAADAAQRARQMRFLASRGFTGETIRQVVRAAAQDEADGDPSD